MAIVARMIKPSCGSVLDLQVRDGMSNRAWIAFRSHLSGGTRLDLLEQRAPRWLIRGANRQRYPTRWALKDLPWEH